MGRTSAIFFRFGKVPEHNDKLNIKVHGFLIN
jgi:hypothetical protein